MSESILSVENLGKKYRLTHQAERPRYTALRDVIANKVKRLFSRNQTSDRSAPTSEEFWALKDVSFEVKQGDVVGIIGRNGAGKSTLLKILSRITEPTEGRVRIMGRVASLLEVGTGFHPELTGRENIFLNGAILGMHRSEIIRKFDEIVAFAETEKFLDTPVKRYSSGMYVRLAFAVAAHLEPEILVVDEVLAVGDAEFQKKCLGKMREVSQGGRTVLFVSHNLASILNLCTKGILLSNGRVIKSDTVREVCEAYTTTRQAARKKEKAGGIFRSLTLIDNSGNSLNAISEGESLRFQCAVRPPAERCLLSLIIKDEKNDPLCELFDRSFAVSRDNGAPTMFSVQIDCFPLRPGQYSVDCWCGDPFGRHLEWFTGALEFEVTPSEVSERGTRLQGPFWFPSLWRGNLESK